MQGTQQHDDQLAASPTAGFVTLAKHDLSAALRTIETLVGFVVEDLGENVSDETAAHLEKIVDRTTQAESLLAGLAQYERAGLCAAPAVDRLNIGSLVNEVGEAIERPQDVALLLDVDPIVCTLDAKALRICLLELMTNAVRHRSEPSGFVRVSVSHSRGFVEIVIEDDGAGIPTDYIDIAFEPLRKLSYTGQVAAGHGLGLATASRLAKAHGANLRLESRESVGTSVRLCWPTIASTTASLRPTMAVQLS